MQAGKLQRSPTSDRAHFREILAARCRGNDDRAAPARTISLAAADGAALGRIVENLLPEIIQPGNCVTVCEPHSRNPQATVTQKLFFAPRSRVRSDRFVVLNLLKKMTIGHSRFCLSTER